MKENNLIYIKNVKIYKENEIIEKGSILIKNGLIDSIYYNQEIKKFDTKDNIIIINGEGHSLIPGFIDTHVHGASNFDVMDSSEKALDEISSVLPKEGVTSYLATTITQSPKNIEKALSNIAEYQTKEGNAEIIGVHLEGPFLEKEKSGAQPLEYISEPDIELFNHWQKISGNKIKTITIAPELDKTGEFIKKLSREKVNISAGHTNANFEEMKKAVEHGVTQLTHLCNAMSSIHHRDIGTVGFAFYNKNILTELIADTIHVVPEMMQIIYDNIGSDRLILITDSMRAKNLNPGIYDHGGQVVHVTADRAQLEDGTLAGSILKMYEGAQNMMKLNGVSIRDIIKMTSSNPSKQLCIDYKKGSISEGKDADLLLIDNKLDIKYTFCNGIIAYKK